MKYIVGLLLAFCFSFNSFASDSMDPTAGMDQATKAHLLMLATKAHLDTMTPEEENEWYLGVSPVIHSYFIRIIVRAMHPRTGLSIQRSTVNMNLVVAGWLAKAIAAGFIQGFAKEVGNQFLPGGVYFSS